MSRGHAALGLALCLSACHHPAPIPPQTDPVPTNDPPWRVGTGTGIAGALGGGEPGEPVVTLGPGPAVDPCPAGDRRWALVAPGDGAAFDPARAVVRGCDDGATYEDLRVLTLPWYVGRGCPWGGAPTDVTFGSSPPPLVAVPHSDRPLRVWVFDVDIACDAHPTVADVEAYRPAAPPAALKPSGFGAVRWTHAEEARRAFDRERAEHYPPAVDAFGYGAMDLAALGAGEVVLYEPPHVWTPPPELLQDRTVATLSVTGRMDRCLELLRTERGTEGKPPAPRKPWAGWAPDAPQTVPEGAVLWMSDRPAYDDVYGWYPVAPRTTDVGVYVGTEMTPSRFCTTDFVPKVARKADAVPAAFRDLVPDVDFAKSMVAWLADPSTDMGNGPVPRDVREVPGPSLHVIVPLVVEDPCGGGDSGSPPPGPRLTDVKFDELLAVYVLPRSSAPLTVRFEVEQQHIRCEP